MFICSLFLYLRPFSDYKTPPFQLTNLHTQDGMEFIMVSVRSSARHLSKTVTFLTPAGRNFLTTVTKVQPLTWVNQFEAFAINGIAGLLHILIYLPTTTDI